MSKLYDLLNTLIGKVNTSVKTVAQTLTAEQKAQARQNIGAAAEGEGGGGTSVQTDWNQTDETAPDFLKNKPFGETPENLMPETEVTGMDEDGLYTVYLDASLFSGTESQLTVKIDGVIYTCAAVDIGNGFPYFGNMGIMGGEDTGEPFILMLATIYGVVMIGFLDSEPHMLSIYGPVVEKLDRKYIDVATTFYMNSDSADEYLYADSSLENKVTVGQLRTANSEGLIFLRYSMDGSVMAVSTYPIQIYAASLDYGYVAIFDAVTNKIKLFYTAERTG